MPPSKLLPPAPSAHALVSSWLRTPTNAGIWELLPCADTGCASCRKAVLTIAFHIFQQLIRDPDDAQAVAANFVSQVYEHGVMTAFGGGRPGRNIAAYLGQFAKWRSIDEQRKRAQIRNERPLAWELASPRSPTTVGTIDLGNRGHTLLVLLARWKDHPDVQAAIAWKLAGTPLLTVLQRFGYDERDLPRFRMHIGRVWRGLLEGKAPPRAKLPAILDPIEFHIERWLS